MLSADRRRRWWWLSAPAVAGGVLATAVAASWLAGGRGATEVVRAVQGPVDGGHTGRSTAVAAMEDGRIVELSTDSGEVLATLATGDVTGGQLGGLSVAADRSTVWFARHDPLAGLPCDSTVMALPLPTASSPSAAVVGTGFAPEVSHGGDRLAYVRTDPIPSIPGSCSYSVAVQDLATGTERSWHLDPAWAVHYGICSLSWASEHRLVVELCIEADTVLHSLHTEEDIVLGDATFIGPSDPDRSWMAPAGDESGGEIVVAERCCLSGSPLSAINVVRVLDPQDGTPGAIRIELPAEVESVTHQDLDAGGEDLLVSTFSFGAESGGTARWLYRSSDGVLHKLTEGVVAAGW